MIHASYAAVLIIIFPTGLHLEFPEDCNIYDRNFREYAFLMIFSLSKNIR